MVGSLDGIVVFRDGLEGPSADAEQIGINLAESLIEKGAAKLLDATRAEVEASAGAAVK
jgi:porphobilinogen deaminase